MRLDASASDMFTLERLRDIVAARAASTDASSYTRSLIEAGIPRISKKIGEEAVETIIAACTGGEREVVSESADLLYHLMVLLHARGVAFEEVWRNFSDARGNPAFRRKPVARAARSE